MLFIICLIVAIISSMFLGMIFGANSRKELEEELYKEIQNNERLRSLYFELIDERANDLLSDTKLNTLDRMLEKVK